MKKDEFFSGQCWTKLTQNVLTLLDLLNIASYIDMALLKRILVLLANTGIRVNDAITARYVCKRTGTTGKWPKLPWILISCSNKILRKHFEHHNRYTEYLVGDTVRKWIQISIIYINHYSMSNSY